MLTLDEKKILLNIARESIEKHVKKEIALVYENMQGVLKENGAAFVTLKIKDQLRGCIGQLIATMPLYRCVQEMAIAAASQDYRFSPVTVNELRNIDIEISYLTPLKKVKDILEIVVGQDGLLVKKDNHQGVLLPQVATDYGWNREEFLTQTCVKANLPKDAWKQRADIFKFQAIIFS